jgi:hypothetical protein
MKRCGCGFLRERRLQKDSNGPSGVSLATRDAVWPTVSRKCIILLISLSSFFCHFDEIRLYFFLFERWCFHFYFLIETKEGEELESVNSRYAGIVFYYY